MHPTEISGSTVSLRPTGVARYFVAAFLAFWLMGWAVGEVVAGGALIGMFAALLGSGAAWLPAALADFTKSGPAAFVIVFLLFWLTFWTFGGITAATQLLRSLAGEDSIALAGPGVEVTRRAGPFRRRYTFDRSTIRRIRLRSHDWALVVDTDRGMRVLTQFGSPEERAGIADWVKAHLGLSDAGAVDRPRMPPVTWDVRSDGENTSIRKVKPRVRTIRAIIAWLLAGAAGLAWSASLDGDAPAGSIAALMFTLFLALGAAVTTWGRREWIARSGELTFQRSFATWHAEQTFRRPARLQVIHSSDSDGDNRYELEVIEGPQRKVIHSQLHDSGEVDDLGRWLADRTGFAFSPSRPQ